MEANLERWAQQDSKGALFIVLKCIHRVIISHQEFQVGKCLGDICGLEGLCFRKSTLMQCGRMDQSKPADRSHCARSGLIQGVGMKRRWM